MGLGVLVASMRTKVAMNNPLVTREWRLNDQNVLNMSPAFRISRTYPSPPGLLSKLGPSRPECDIHHRSPDWSYQPWHNGL